MNFKSSAYFILLLIFFFPWKNTWGQFPEDLVKRNCNETIKYLLDFNIPEKSYKSIRNSRGRKLSFSDVQLNYYGKEIPVKSLKIRGKTTLYYPKKSFALKLKKKISIQGIHDTVTVKDCYLLGLTMDKNYIENYIAYSLLDKLKIFSLTFSFCEVVINNDSQGIYLIIERPEDYTFKTIKSPVLIRRGFENNIDKIEVKSEDQLYSSKFFRKKFSHMYSMCAKYSGQQLYDSLNCYMDMSQYMKWLAFNYIIRNGDYTDELYLYFNLAEKRFGIIPWDYDDSFARYPHEGKDARNDIKGGQFIFSSEDQLDKTIIKDEYLYRKYCEELYQVTELLNDSIIIDIFQNAYCSVYPYYLDNDIIQTTQFDQYGTTSKEDLFIDIRQKLITFRAMRDMVRQQIK